MGTGLGIWKTTSGGGMFHPSVQRGAGGASWASPGALVSAQAPSVWISRSVNEGSSAKYPQQGSANQGGIRFELVFLAMSRAQGRTSSYVTSGIGAISPAR